MHVTYGRERSKAARRATVDISPEFGTGGSDEGRDQPLLLHKTADGKELCTIVLTKPAGIHGCLHSQSASSAAT